MSIVCYAAPYGSSSNARILMRAYSEDGQGGMREGVYRFTVEERAALEADWLFVGDSAANVIHTNIPRERRVLFLMEPPAIREYPLPYLEQFGVLVTPAEIVSYSGKCVVGNPCLGWFAGIGMGSDVAGAAKFNSFEEVKKYTPPKKERRVSIVSSLKKRSQGHRERLAFLKEMQSYFGDKVDYYGRNLRSVEDKLDAIAPYKYHVAIENCQLENYWTEKLADAWVGWSLPIYCGDPSILRQVPNSRGLEVIDVRDVQTSLRKIERLLEEDPYEERLTAIQECRDWALRKSNPYERLCEIAESLGTEAGAIPRLQTIVEIQNPGYYTFKGTVYRAFSTILGRERAAAWKKRLKNLGR